MFPKIGEFEDHQNCEEGYCPEGEGQFEEY